MKKTFELRSLEIQFNTGDQFDSLFSKSIMSLIRIMPSHMPKLRKLSIRGAQFEDLIKDQKDVEFL